MAASVVNVIIGDFDTYTSSTVLCISSDPLPFFGGSSPTRYLVYFDLLAANIPLDATVTAVTVTLNIVSVVQSGDLDISGFLITGLWDMSAFTCASKYDNSNPAVANDFIVGTDVSSTGSKTFTGGAGFITTVQGWVDNGEEDLTLAFTGAVASETAGYEGVVHGTVSTGNEPTLTISYTIPDQEYNVPVDDLNIPITFPAPSFSFGQDHNASTLDIPITFPLPIARGGTVWIPEKFEIPIVLNTPTITRPNNPDNISGKMGIALITRGSIASSSDSGDGDATPVHLIVQDGGTYGASGIKGIGLNRDGSPWLPDDTDLGSQLSGAACNMSELIFPEPMYLEELEVFLKNMNETRGDKYQFSVLVDGTSRVRTIGAPVQSNGRMIIPISRALGPIHRVMLQVTYTNTDTAGSSVTLATPCAITKMALWGSPVNDSGR